MHRGGIGLRPASPGPTRSFDTLPEVTSLEVCGRPPVTNMLTPILSNDLVGGQCRHAATSGLGQLAKNTLRTRKQTSQRLATILPKIRRHHELRAQESWSSRWIRRGPKEGCGPTAHKNFAEKRRERRRHQEGGALLQGAGRRLQGVAHPELEEAAQDEQLAKKRRLTRAACSSPRPSCPNNTREGRRQLRRQRDGRGGFGPHTTCSTAATASAWPTSSFCKVPAKGSETMDRPLASG